MARTSLLVPDDLLEWARREAVRRGVSLAEIVREALESKRAALTAEEDPWFSLHAPYEGPGPTDLAERHDDHLAEIMEEEHGD
jgi:hypothetical protein